jgi:hypothetical protein
MSYYPAIVFPPDADGLVGCLVPDLLINATGRDRDDALADAVRSMDELLAEMGRDGEPFPEPTPLEALDSMGGLIVLLHARTSQAA